jgi:hydroxymethylglutaryl-CoA synthase
MSPFGTERMKDVGNLYTAALPAWMAAALDEAAGGDCELAGRRLLSVGYGSGDAAEVMVMRGAPDWRAAAQRIDFDAALHHAHNLDSAAYEALHDGRLCGPRVAQAGVFYIDSVGAGAPEFDDRGIEYYRLQT